MSLPFSWRPLEIPNVDDELRLAFWRIYHSVAVNMVISVAINFVLLVLCHGAIWFMLVLDLLIQAIGLRHASHWHQRLDRELRESAQ